MPRPQAEAPADVPGRRREPVDGPRAAPAIRSIVHAPQASDAKSAVALGAGALAHGVLEPLDGETIQKMAAAPVFYIPTMGVFEFLADTRRYVEEVLADRRATAGLPPDTVRRYRSPDYSAGYRERYPNFRRVQGALPVLRRNLIRLREAGVPVALGTDMWAFPGLGVSAEMGLYVRAGLAPLEALRAATQTAARSLGLADRGAVAPGLRADFLLLDADPLADVTNVRRSWASTRGNGVAPMTAGARRDPDRASPRWPPHPLSHVTPAGRAARRACSPRAGPRSLRARRRRCGPFSREMVRRADRLRARVDRADALARGELL